MTVNPVSWLRWGVVAFIVIALVLATLAGAVETGRVHPHSKAGRSITGLTDPLVAPVRRTIDVGGGGLGHGAAFWFGVTAVVTGAVAASCLEWALFPRRGIGEAAAAPSRRGIAIGVTAACAAILAFVLLGLWGSPAGAPRTAWWVAPFGWSTGWAVDALAGRVPRIAALNLAAGVTYAALRFGRWFFVRAT